MNADAANVRRAIDAMNAPLRAKCDMIREILAEHPDESVEVRHRIGRVVMEITNDAQKFGAHALALLAAALGRDETSLYRYAHVAGRWSADAIARVVARRTTSGTAVSWSHLIELSTVASRREREALLERTFAEALSVRDLVRIVRSGKRSQRARSSPIVAIERRLREVEEISRRLTEASSDYELVSQLSAQSSGVKERVLDLLVRARKVHERIGEDNAAVLARVAALRRAARRGR